MKAFYLAILFFTGGFCFAQEAEFMTLSPATTISNAAPGETGITYHVYVPTTFKQDNPPPLIIAFSPGGKGHQIMTKLKPSAEKAGWLLVGVDKLRNGMKDEALETQMEDEVLDDIFRRIPHNPQRIYLSGFSGGAMRAYGITARRKEPYAGVIAYGGWLGGDDYQELPFRESMAVAIINGVNDKGANKWDEIDSATLKKRNCRIQKFTHPGGHKIAPSDVKDAVLQWLQEDWEAMSHKKILPIKPGTTYYVNFPELGQTWKDEPAKAGIYFPTDYSPDKTYPMLVWFGGGAGTNNPKKAAAITEGKGYICIALPYRTDKGEEAGGWQTPWPYYQTMLKKLETLAPNADPQKRVAGGYSSGGAAVMHQLGHSNEAFQNYFHAFIPAGAGWPMGGLESIKGRPMLAIIGANDKRRVNFEKLDEAAREAGVDITFLVLEGVGHKFPETSYPQVREWLRQKVEMPYIK
ncbi:hypothetical protein [Pontiella sulfatireligans]|uniref:Phospholipase/carboxylesterase/thioesterase domain-containing protein n=1 Tax=Pontiella sulfatireligans TaxID=2750658 RepID=A0A6C2UTH2_9BACT|nr:hypothetical protein [Pontiella sulfatireligans]VGO22206.1 hypothetical protein SCARR_04288 [Pontiella sulfatireligans]